jgi:hypothetical protein
MGEAHQFRADWILPPASYHALNFFVNKLHKFLPPEFRDTRFGKSCAMLFAQNFATAAPMGHVDVHSVKIRMKAMKTLQGVKQGDGTPIALMPRKSIPN